MGKKLSAKSSKIKSHKVHAKPNPPEPWSDDGTTKLLISFSNPEGSSHYFYSSALGGGEAVELCCLPGCNKENSTSPCTCYVSHPLNGLLCFHNGMEVSVFNPTTGDVMSLPKNSLGTDMSHNSVLNAQYSVYSLGFDPTKNEYKIVHVYGIRHGSNTAMLCDLQCEVFTLRVAKEEEAKEEEGKKAADLWRKTKNVLPCPYMFKSQGVCVNGAIHWIGMNSTREDVIICFDVATERFRLFPISFTIPYRAGMSEIRGRLAIHGVEERDSVASLGLWILEDYEGLVWKKSNVGIANPKEHKGFKVYVLVGNDSTGDMLLTRKVISERYDVVPFNGGEKIAGKRTVRIDGLPSWVDLSNGAKNLNFRIQNFKEDSRVWLEPIVEKVEEEVKVEEKASTGRRHSQKNPQNGQGAHGGHPPVSSPQNHPQAPPSYEDVLPGPPPPPPPPQGGFRGPVSSHPQDGFRGPTPAYSPQPPRRRWQHKPRAATLGDFIGL